MAFDACPPLGTHPGPVDASAIANQMHHPILEPISLDAYSPEDATNLEALDEIYLKVTGAMQRALDDMARERTMPIVG